MFRQAARSFGRVIRASARPMKGAAAALGGAAVRSFSRAASKPIAKKIITTSALTFGAVVGGATVVLADGVNYTAVRKDIEALLEDNEDMGPTIVRLAWHASGTYSKADGSGGSDGATMRFHPECAHAANAGLDKARNFLESVKAKHPSISYADLWTLAGVVAIEAMGGPSIGWRSGRSDAPSGDHCTPDGRLPDADKGTRGSTIQHVRDIFYRMGFNDREIVALIGAHAVGRCHADASGYDGPWTFSPTTFSNEFYRLLIEERWTLRKWNGPEQYQDPSGSIMMLPADMAFVWDPEFRKYVELYARDEETFFKDFAAAFQKLEELGCDFSGSYYSYKG